MKSDLQGLYLSTHVNTDGEKTYVNSLSPVSLIEKCSADQLQLSSNRRLLEKCSHASMNPTSSPVFKSPSFGEGLILLQ